MNAIYLVVEGAMAAMAASSARAIWKGNISFGLVNIPIQVFSATQKEEYTSFNQLCDKGHKIKYKKWCPVEEREVQWSEIKKGYEITKAFLTNNKVAVNIFITASLSL